MDESLKTSVAEIVGQVLEARKQLLHNQDQIQELKVQIENLCKANSNINKQIEADKRLIDYVLETGEDPVAARLTLNQKEIDKKTKQIQQVRQAALQREANHSSRDFIFSMGSKWANLENALILDNDSYHVHDALSK